MAGAGVSGVAVLYATAGGILLWSGFKGQTLKETITAITSGNAAALNQSGSEKVGSPTFSIDTGSGTGGSGGGTASQAQASLLSGQSIPGVTVGIPAGVAAQAGATGTPSLNKAAAMLLAASVGWAGAQWTALDNVEMAEAGWNNLAQNPQSGAFGVAQALGHGTAGTAGKYGNNYGADYGLTTSQAIAANNGSFTPQFLWMLGYIKATYGTPEAAWEHEQANSWY